VAPRTKREERESRTAASWITEQIEPASAKTGRMNRGAQRPWAYTGSRTNMEKNKSASDHYRAGKRGQKKDLTKQWDKSHQQRTWGKWKTNQPMKSKSERPARTCSWQWKLDLAVLFGGGLITGLAQGKKETPGRDENVNRADGRTTIFLRKIAMTTKQNHQI
jgi:hypothetical protein